MRFWLRKPSLAKMIWARTSPSRFIAHSLWVKMPRGYWFLRNPKKAAYNKIYYRSTFSIAGIIKALFR